MASGFEKRVWCCAKFGEILMIGEMLRYVTPLFVVYKYIGFLTGVFFLSTAVFTRYSADF